MGSVHKGRCALALRSDLKRFCKSRSQIFQERPSEDGNGREAADVPRSPTEAARRFSRFNLFAGVFANSLTFLIKLVTVTRGSPAP